MKIKGEWVKVSSGNLPENGDQFGVISTNGFYGFASYVDGFAVDRVGYVDNSAILAYFIIPDYPCDEETLQRRRDCGIIYNDKE